MTRDSRDRDARRLQCPIGQLGPGVRHEEDQSGANFLRRADWIAERQRRGRGPFRVIAGISKPYLSTPVNFAEVISLAFGTVKTP